MNEKLIGEISISSGKVNIGDPAKKNENLKTMTCLNGRYDCYITYCQGRISSLTIINKTVNCIGRRLSFLDTHNCVKSSSLLAGFYDNKPDYDEKNWKELCVRVFTANRYGFLPCGVWSVADGPTGNLPIYVALSNDSQHIPVAFKILYV